MAVTLPDTRQLSDEVLEALRLRAVCACERGFTQADVASVLGVAPETVCRWWGAYAAGGLGAIPHDRTGRPPGSGALSDDQAAHIQQLIGTSTPEAHGLAFPLWSRPAIGALIHQECGVVLAVRTVGEYLRRWGYTANKPARHARRQDPDGMRSANHGADSSDSHQSLTTSLPPPAHQDRVPGRVEMRSRSGNPE